jgi:polysaccharide pyruvyl transferase WcaK-like protein/glycosyltransferase involved in cell wall biosynthesis
MNVLLIAPYAPPKNAAEAIQVRRILAELDTQVTGHLVTIQPTSDAWMQYDETLALNLQHFDTHNLKLPFHRFTNRLFMSRYASWLQNPDSMGWTTWMSGRVIRKLKQKPDIIYSRSSPMSAAILGLKLKQKLNVPWIMHLSDPWEDNPYVSRAHGKSYEAECFLRADAIMLTTHGQAAFYRKKYPAFANKISVSPNVMPDQTEIEPHVRSVTPSAHQEPLRIVFAGNLYGNRSPKPLIDAIGIVGATRPDILKKLHIDIYGKADSPSLALLQQLSSTIHYHGPVSFREAVAAQHAADVVLSIEPDIPHSLSACFLPSKVLESLALGKPLLAITPHGSETEAMCREGYGWAVNAADTKVLAAHLITLVETVEQLRVAPHKAPPTRYMARHVTSALLQHMQQVIAAKTAAPVRNVLMEGYYGRGNFGDDVLLKVTYNLLKHILPDAQIVLVVGNEQTDYVRTMLDGVDILAPDRHAHFDRIVHGGGGVFFDFRRYGFGYRFAEALLKRFGFPLALNGERILRRACNKPRVSTSRRLGLGIGIGTFSSGSPRLWRSLPILAEFDALWVRDGQSKANLKRFASIMHAELLQGSDLAFLSEYWLPASIPPRADALRPRLGVVLRDWSGTDSQALRASIARFAEKYDVTGFIFDEHSDPELGRILSPYTTHVWRPHHMHMDDFARHLAAQDVLLTSRAHGAICGACLGVPSVIVNIEPKLEQIHAMLPNASILVSYRSVG